MGPPGAETEMRRTPVVLATGMLALGVMAVPAMAFHPSFGFDNEPVVPPHQHFINGQLVGPNACEDGPSIQFDHFHLNVHIGQPGFGAFREEGRDGLLLVESRPCPAE